MPPARRAAAVVTAAALTACGPVSTGGPCRPAVGPVALPDALSESSGVAVSVRHPGLFWTHNDAGDDLFGVDDRGRIQARVRLPLVLRDWEDLARADCGDGASCLYAADVGDNYERHGTLRLVRFAEPALDDTRVAAVDVFPVRLPDGPRDIESLVVLPGEQVLLVTKGRNHPVTVFRYPGALRPDTVTLEPVQALTDGPPILPRQFTGGAAAPGGRVVALRTYQSLRFYGVEGDTLAALDGGLVNLRVLNESQGEAVAVGNDGLVVLTSEGGPGGGPASLTLLRCRVSGL